MPHFSKRRLIILIAVLVLLGLAGLFGAWTSLVKTSPTTNPALTTTLPSSSSPLGTSGVRTTTTLNSGYSSSTTEPQTFILSTPTTVTPVITTSTATTTPKSTTISTTQPGSTPTTSTTRVVTTEPATTTTVPPVTSTTLPPTSTTTVPRTTTTEVPITTTTTTTAPATTTTTSPATTTSTEPTTTTEFPTTTTTATTEVPTTTTVASTTTEPTTSTTIPSRPAAPTSFTAAPASNTSTELTWDTAPDTSYSVTGEPSCTESGCIISGLNPDTLYNFFLTASQNGQNSDPAVASATTPFTGQIDLSLVSLTDTSLTVSWPAVDGATEYSVTGDATCQTVEATTCTLTGLDPNTPYTLTVTASYGLATDASPSATFTTLLATPTPSVSDITATSASVSWPTVSGAVNYLVTMDSNTTVVTETTYPLTSLLPNEQYQVSVVAQNPNGESYPGMVTFTTLPIVVTTTTTVPVTATTEQPTTTTEVATTTTTEPLTTTTEPPTTTTTTEEATTTLPPTTTTTEATTTSTTEVPTTTTTSTSTTQVPTTTTTLPPTTTSTTQPVTTSTTTVPQTTTTTEATTTTTIVAQPPASPTDFTATPTSNTSIELTWTSVPGTSYSVADAPACAESGCIISGLTPDTIYDFSLVASQNGQDSNPATASATTPFAGTIDLSLTNRTDTTLTISWDAVDGATGYSVTGDQTCQTVEATTCTLTNLTPDTPYTLSVSASYDTAADTSPSATFSTLLATPAPTVSDISSDSASIAWPAVSGATSYLITVGSTTATVTDTTYQLTSLLPNTDYQVSVVAQNSDSYSASGPTSFTTLPLITTTTTEPATTTSTTSTTTSSTTSTTEATTTTTLPPTTTTTEPATTTTTEVATTTTEAPTTTTTEPPTTTTQPTTTTEAPTTSTTQPTTSTTTEPVTTSTTEPPTTTTTEVATTTTEAPTTTTTEPTTTTTTEPAPLAAPTGFSAATTSNTTVTLTWDQLPGITYDVAGYQDCTTSGCLITGLSPDTTYTFDLTAQQNAQTSQPTSASATTSFTGTLSPTISNSSDTTLTISWNPVEGATSYQVSGDGSCTTLDATSCTLTSLDPNTPYQFTVAALYGSDSISDTVSGTTLLSSPDVTISNLTDTSATASWPAVPGATSYDITLNGTPLPATSSPQVDLTLSPGTDYTLTVIAISDSNTSSTTTATFTSLPTPTTTTLPPITTTTVLPPPSSDIALSTPPYSGPVPTTTPPATSYYNLPTSTPNGPTNTDPVINDPGTAANDLAVIDWGNLDATNPVDHITPLYTSLGGPAGTLGNPLNSPYMVVGDEGQGQAEDFEGGSIYWSQATGAHVVNSDALSTWYSVATSSGYLGFPIADSYAFATGIRTDFQGGSIYADSSGAHFAPAAFWDRWATLNLGEPTSNSSTTGYGIGTLQDFANGYLYSYGSGAPYEIDAALGQAWFNNSGESGYLGAPISDTYTFNGGIRSDFQGGVIFQLPNQNPVYTDPNFLSKWASLDTLGDPTSNILADPTANKLLKQSGSYDFEDFQGGEIFSNHTTQDNFYAITQPVLPYWQSLHKELGALGEPTGDTYQDQYGVYHSAFLGGSITCSADWSLCTASTLSSGETPNQDDAPGGTFATEAAASGLGDSTSPVQPTYDGIGLYQTFTNGMLYWSPAYGAHAIMDSLPLYQNYGYERGNLGYPLTDMEPFGSGSIQYFAGGAVLEYPGQAPFVTSAANAQVWVDSGALQGPLGAPTTDVHYTSDYLSQIQDFQNGAIFITPSEGVYYISGASYSQWANTGYERGGLGYATGSTYTWNGFERTDFKGGSIIVIDGRGYTMTPAELNTWYANQSLGLPVSDPYYDRDANGMGLTFQNGAIYTSPAFGTHAILNPVFQLWASEDYEWGYLGYPTSDAVTSNGLTTQAFQGAILVSNGTNSFATTRGIYTSWAANLAAGWATDPSYFFVNSDLGNNYTNFGEEQGFANGSYGASMATNPHYVDAHLMSRWNEAGYYNGFGGFGSFVGFPTDDTYNYGGLQRNDAQNGTVVYDGTSVWYSNPIPLTKWADLGGLPSLGAPQDDYASVGAGYFQDFANGSIYTSSATGTHWVPSTITGRYTGATYYGNFGGPAGGLGFPTTDPYAIGGATEVNFQNGVLVNISGLTYLTTSDIMAKWEGLGGLGVVGAPTSDVVSTVNGGLAQNFANGTIYVSTAGIHYIVSAINGTYGGASYYGGFDGPTGPLGYPITDTYTVQGGLRTDFQTDSLFWSATSGTIASTPDVLDYWNSLGGDQSPLGLPVSNLVDVTGGLAQNFQNGAIYYSAQTGYHFLLNTSNSRYVDATYYGGFGGPTGSLGFPTSDTYFFADGQRADYQNGTLFWSQTSNTVNSTSTILDFWNSTSADLGPLGNVVGDVQAVGSATQEYFANGYVFSTSTGTYMVLSPITDRYLDSSYYGGFDGLTGSLGYPTANIYLFGDGYRADFQNGTLYKSTTSDAVLSSAGLMDYWNSTGADLGPLGFPVGDIQQASGIEYQYFTNGAIYYSSATGYHFVLTVADSRYTESSTYGGFSGPTGTLGLPTGNTYLFGDGYRTDFQNGSLFSDSLGNTYESDAGTLDYWNSTGADLGPLGAITSDLTSISGGKQQDFAGGSIYYSAATDYHYVLGATNGTYRDSSNYGGFNGVGGTLGFPAGNTTPTYTGYATLFQNGELDFTTSTGQVTQP